MDDFLSLFYMPCDWQVLRATYYTSMIIFMLQIKQVDLKERLYIFSGSMWWAYLQIIIMLLPAVKEQYCCILTLYNCKHD